MDEQDIYSSSTSLEIPKLHKKLTDRDNLKYFLSSFEFEVLLKNCVAGFVVLS